MRDLRDRAPAGAIEDELRAATATAQVWLGRYNHSLHGRIHGYLALSRLCGFELPWPVVAVLGLSQVARGLTLSRLCGLAGVAAERLGYPALSEMASHLDDAMLRTNRAIFEDSVPMVLLALRCDRLRREGRSALAAALLDGPGPAWLEDENRPLCRALYDALGIADREARFAMLAALTRRQFEREQAIFSRNMQDAFSPAGKPFLVRCLLRLAPLAAPVVERTRRGRSIAFRRLTLPAGFALADHRARVEVLGRAFVDSVTATPADYAAAVAYVSERFGRDGAAQGVDAIDLLEPAAGAPRRPMEGAMLHSVPAAA